MDSSPSEGQPDGSSPPTALLIDFGGVLTSPVLDAFRSLSLDVGLAPDEALSLFVTHEGARTTLVEHEVGRLDDETFEEAIAAALTDAGARVEPQGLLARLDGYLDLEESMLETVREVRRSGVPVALVSNSLGRNCYARVDLDELFDVSLISSRAGVRKPSRRIYRIACERLGVAPRSASWLTIWSTTSSARPDSGSVNSPSHRAGDDIAPVGESRPACRPHDHPMKSIQRT